MKDEQFDYPVDLGNGHLVGVSMDYSGDKFGCDSGAYMHTGAWPTWDYCPFCGQEVSHD